MTLVEALIGLVIGVVMARESSVEEYGPEDIIIMVISVVVVCLCALLVIKHAIA